MSIYLLIIGAFSFQIIIIFFAFSVQSFKVIKQGENGCDYTKRCWLCTIHICTHVYAEYTNTYIEKKGKIWLSESVNVNNGQ